MIVEQQGEVDIVADEPLVRQPRAKHFERYPLARGDGRKKKPGAPVCR